jgi:hypothetical protein
LRAVVDGKGTRDIGVRPAVSIDQTNGPRYVTIENLEVRNIIAHGISIAETLDTGVTEANNTIRNCYVHHTTGVANPAINIYGQNIRVERCIVEDVASDGILFRGRGYVGHNTIRRVSNTGGGFGDGIQVDGKHGSSIVEFNDITRENSDKQALLVVGDGSIVRFNTVRGLSVGAGLLTIFESKGNQVYGNTLVGTDGIYLLEATGPHIACGNVVIGTNRNEFPGNSTGVDTGSTYVHAHRIINNTVVGHRRGVYARNAVCHNNIVLNCGTGIDLGVGAVSESNNLVYGCDVAWLGTAGSGAMTFDPTPYLRSDYSLRPLEGPGQLGNPLIGAGVYLPGVRLMNGSRLSARLPVIGAHSIPRFRAARRG